MRFCSILGRKPMTNKKKKIPAGKQADLSTGKSVIYRSPGFLIFGLIIITAVFYFPSLKNGFMETWDDNVYITENIHVTHWGPDSFKEIFTKPVNQSYVPLPMLTFAVEYGLFGKNPIPFHVSNLLLHILCTLLVFQLLRLLNLDIGYAALGALLAGIHPMRVESVAWITERKDLLYSLFYLASMIFYIRSFQDKEHKVIYRLLSLFTFIFALLSKIQAVTLPVCLMLLDYYFERPVSIKMVLEKWAYWVLSLVTGVTGIFLLNQGGALKANEILTIGDRIFYGFYSITLYLFRFIVPVNLGAAYPYPVPDGAELPWYIYLNAVLLILLVILLFRKFKRNRVILFGTLFFLVNIIFMLQILAAGTAFLADRFTYISYIGLFLIAAWLIEKSARKLKAGENLLILALAVFVLYFGPMTFSRCQVWKNGETLWTDVIEKYPGKVPISYVSRGDYYQKTGQTEKAMDDYNEAISLSPKESNAYLGRGSLNLQLGKYDKAVSDYKSALVNNPENLVAYRNLCVLYILEKDYDQGVEVAVKGLSLYPGDPVIHVNLGYCYLDKDQYPQAIEHFRKGMENTISGRGNFDALFGLSLACYCQNNKSNARQYLLEAQQIQPLLNQGPAGLEELTKTGSFYSEKEKDIFKKMFEEMK
jgi:protein O-mannosyl-transferase